MPKRLTYEYVKKYVEDFGYILLSKEYNRNCEYLNMLCPCGHSIEITFSNFKNGRRCGKCAKKIRADKKRYSYKYVKEYIESFGFELLSTEYKGSYEYLKIKCPNNHVYEACFNNFKNGKKRCPYCYGNKKKNIEQIRQYLEHFDYKLLSSEYINNSEKLDIMCPNGHTFKMAYSNFQQGKRCSECQGIHKYTYEEVKNYIESFGYNLLSTEYKNNTTKLKIMCRNGHIFEMDFSHFKNHNNRCSVCNISKGEQRIMDYLNDNNVEYIYDSPYFKDLLSPSGFLLRPDFIIEDKKIWIEYDGEFHYRDSYKDGAYEKTILYDRIKDEYAQKNNWNLIRIPYWEYDNIEEILRREIND